MFRKVITLCAAVLAFAVLAAPPASAGAHILDYGLYSVQSYGCDNAIIANCQEANIVHLATVTDVPGALGVTFGFHYMRDAASSGDMQLVSVFPPAGLHNPAFPHAIPSYSHSVACTIGYACHWGYTFDFPWEIVPGIWTMQVWENGTPLFQKKFNVILPNKKKGKPAKGTPTARLGDHAYRTRSRFG